MNSQAFTPNHAFNIGNRLYVAANARVESLIAAGTINDTDRLLEMTKNWALKALSK